MATWWIFDDSIQPEWAVEFEKRINNKIGKLMALVKVEQADLDALDQGLDEATAALSAKIQALVDAGNVPAGDVSALQADVEALRALSAPTPAEPEQPAEPDQPTPDQPAEPTPDQPTPEEPVV